MQLAKDNEIPSFIYTSAHCRDLESIKQMARDLLTSEWAKVDPRHPSLLEEEGWELLD